MSAPGVKTGYRPVVSSEQEKELLDKEMEPILSLMPESAYLGILRLVAAVVERPCGELNDQFVTARTLPRLEAIIEKIFSPLGRVLACDDDVAAKAQEEKLTAGRVLCEPTCTDELRTVILGSAEPHILAENPGHVRRCAGHAAALDLCELYDKLKASPKIRYLAPTLWFKREHFTIVVRAEAAVAFEPAA